MLHITIPETEFFDEKKDVFCTVKETKISLEHSLISISKWESKWHKPFLDTKNKSTEEVIDYIKCMTITQNVNDNVYECLTGDIINKINEYIENPMTATWFNEGNNPKRNRKIITSEVIYGWMVAFNIPVEFEKWHLNRLITLIRVCEINNSGNKKKMPMKKVIEDNKLLNEKRKKIMNTTG